mgnify:CR=1 FL=1
MIMTKKIIKKILSYFFLGLRAGLGLFFRARSWRPVWLYLNRYSRALYQRNRRPLNPVQHRLMEDLKRDGIAAVALSELFPGENVFAELRSYTDRLIDQAETKTNKEFLRFLWDATPVLELDNPFVRLSLRDKILDIVNAYMDLAAHFYYLTLNVTMPVPEGSQAVQSQRWHRDPEDKRMCKVFLYLTDVDEGAGPFPYVRGSQYGGKWGRLFPQQPPAGCYPPAGAIERIVPSSDIHVGTARAGTLIFCDTSGLHRGGYATQRERVMFTGGYCSSASPWPLRFKYPENSDEELKRLNFDPVQRHALQYDQSAFVRLAFKKIKKGFKYG